VVLFEAHGHFNPLKFNKVAEESPPELTGTEVEKKIERWKKRIGHNIISMFLFLFLSVLMASIQGGQPVLRDF
jgi:hypothetical protein